MGRANRGGSAGARAASLRTEATSEIDLSSSRKILGVRDHFSPDSVGLQTELSKHISSGAVPSLFIDSLSETANRRLMNLEDRSPEKLAEIMKALDPEFQDEQFLREVSSQDSLTEQDYNTYAYNHIRSQVNLDELAIQSLKESGASLQDQQDPYEIRVARSRIYDEIKANPEQNKYGVQQLANAEEWLHRAPLRSAWYRAGGSQEILEMGRVSSTSVFAAATGLRHEADVPVSVFSDEGSSEYFLNEEGGNFYGNRRSYVAVVDGEDRNIEVEEIRNEDGRSLRLESHGIHVRVSEGGGAYDEEPFAVFKTDGKTFVAPVAPEEIAESGGLEGFAFSLLEQSVRQSKAARVS